MIKNSTKVKIDKKLSSKPNQFAKRAGKWKKLPVSPATTLPPKVQGQLRCFLGLKIDQVLWYTHNSPKITFVRVVWWGEEGPGTIFKPIDPRLETNDKRAETYAKFEVRSGPKQFNAYLKDMGNLIMEVLVEGYVPLGVASVPNLQNLQTNSQISGLYPIRAKNGENLGELKVSLLFQSVTDDEFYNIPTPDYSLNDSSDREPINPPNFVSMEKPRVYVDDGHLKAISNENFPRGIDSKLQISEIERPSRSKKKSSIKSRSRSNSRDSDKKKNGVFDHKNGLDYDSVRSSYCDDNEFQLLNRQFTNFQYDNVENKLVDVKSESNGKNDILKNILERGTKLRDEMARSSQKSKPLKSCLRKGEDFSNVKQSYDFDEGYYAQDILKHSDHESNSYQRTVDLVIGDTLANEKIRTLKTMYNSFDSDESPSFSDTNDLLHDQKILNALFYNDCQVLDNDIHSDFGDNISEISLKKNDIKHQTPSLQNKPSNENLNNFLQNDGNKRPPSRSTSVGSLSSTPLSTPRLQKRISRKRSTSSGKFRKRSTSSEKKYASDSEIQKTKTMKKTKQAKVKHTKLTIDKVALLGKVSLARLLVENLSLKSAVISKKQKKTKETIKNKLPPKHSTIKKLSTYFVEYQFPVSVLNSESRKASIGTEIVRMASKKIIDDVIIFGHRSVFPVSFDGIGIEKWLKSRIVFKVFCKNHNNRIPKLIGTSILCLDNVIISDKLFACKELDLRDRSKDGEISSDTGSERSSPIVGKLKVTLELGGNEGIKFQEQLRETKSLNNINDSSKNVTINEPVNTIDIKTIKDIEICDERSLNTNSNSNKDNMTFHTILMIPKGSGISFQGVSIMKSLAPTSSTTSVFNDKTLRNIFLVCRMFWSDDIIKSAIIWGTFDPEFHFVQVTPLIARSEIIEKFKNNWVIIEVWNKSVGVEEDTLIGLVKLSVNQFYVSYKDKRIAESLILSEFPVIAVDDSLPIIHPITHKQYGFLQVVLAMGTQDQVSRLQRTKSFNEKENFIEENTSVFKRNFERISRQYIDQSKHFQTNFGKPIKCNTNSFLPKTTIPKVKNQTLKIKPLHVKPSMKKTLIARRTVKSINTPSSNSCKTVFSSNINKKLQIQTRNNTTDSSQKKSDVTNKKELDKSFSQSYPYHIKKSAIRKSVGKRKPPILPLHIFSTENDVIYENSDMLIPKTEKFPFQHVGNQKNNKTLKPSNKNNSYNKYKKLNYLNDIKTVDVIKSLSIIKVDKNEHVFSKGITSAPTLEMHNKYIDENDNLKQKNVCLIHNQVEIENHNDDEKNFQLNYQRQCDLKLTDKSKFINNFIESESQYHNSVDSLINIDVTNLSQLENSNSICEDFISPDEIHSNQTEISNSQSFTNLESNNKLISNKIEIGIKRKSVQLAVQNNSDKSKISSENLNLINKNILKTENKSEAFFDKYNESIIEEMSGQSNISCISYFQNVINNENDLQDNLKYSSRDKQILNHYETKSKSFTDKHRNEINKLNEENNKKIGSKRYTRKNEVVNQLDYHELICQCSCCKTHFCKYSDAISSSNDNYFAVCSHGTKKHRLKKQNKSQPENVLVEDEILEIVFSENCDNKKVKKRECILPFCDSRLMKSELNDTPVKNMFRKQIDCNKEKRDWNLNANIEHSNSLSLCIETTESTSNILIEKLVDHLFEVNIESIKSLANFDTLLWGEADCFVQYHFPTQIKERFNINIQAAPILKAYRSATTLCIPDPKFNDKLKHKISLPDSSSIQRELVGACAGAGTGAGGVTFEIWCRFYHPNIRDQVIAKTMLPVAKLCALATMYRYGEPSIQTFHLPLSKVVPNHAKDHDPDADVPRIEPSGFLEVTINYQTKIASLSKKLECDESIVLLSVSIQKVCGLKSAAICCSKSEPSLTFTPDVGLNAYFKVNLSMLAKEEERITQTIARTLAGDFSCHFDFPLPLLWYENDDSRCLAEDLEKEYLVLELWHQANDKIMDLSSRKQFSTSHDSLIAISLIPLRNLLTKSIGIRSWFPLQTPDSIDYNDTTFNENVSTEFGLENVVGGIEAGLKFSHGLDDWKRVIETSKTCGWQTSLDIEDLEYDLYEDLYGRIFNVSIKIQDIAFLISLINLDNDKRSDEEIYCFARFRFFNCPSYFSHLWKIHKNSYGYAIVSGNLEKEFKIESSRSFFCYLREDQLEIQIWCTNEPRSINERPTLKDKLVGSAFVDLLALRKSKQISSVFPLFKPAAPNMGGSCLRVILDIKSSLNEKNLDDNIRTINDIPKDCFRCQISIERAFHLPKVDNFDSKQEKLPPAAYVTYQSAEKSDVLFTLVQTSINPVWNYEVETFLDNYLLESNDKDLIFKVWHAKKANLLPDISTDKVLGYVSVDLKPLKAGLKQISGYYHVMDFVGKCQGQIFISVTPISPINVHNKISYSTAPAGFNFQVEDVKSKSFSKSATELFSNVRHWHQEIRSVRHQFEATSPSKSDLMKCLNSNMRDLDEITIRLKERLKDNEITYTKYSPESDKYKTPTDNPSTDEEFLIILEKARALLNSSSNTKSSASSIIESDIVGSHLTNYSDKKHVTSASNTLINDTCNENNNNNNNNNNSDSDNDYEIEEQVEEIEEIHEENEEVLNTGGDVENNEEFLAAYHEENSQELSWISSAHHSKSQDFLTIDENGFDIDSNKEKNEAKFLVESTLVLPKSLNNLSDIDFNNWDPSSTNTLKENVIFEELDDNEKQLTNDMVLNNEKCLENGNIIDERVDCEERMKEEKNDCDVSNKKIIETNETIEEDVYDDENFCDDISIPEIRSVNNSQNFNDGDVIFKSTDEEKEEECDGERNSNLPGVNENEIRNSLKESVRGSISPVSSIGNDKNDIDYLKKKLICKNEEYPLPNFEKQAREKVKELSNVRPDQLNKQVESKKLQVEKHVSKFSLKTLPTSEETKRIAKIFSSKLNVK